MAEAIPLIIKVLSKSMDTSLAVDKVELSTITRDPATGKVSCTARARCQRTFVNKKRVLLFVCARPHLCTYGRKGGGCMFLRSLIWAE